MSTMDDMLRATEKRGHNMHERRDCTLSECSRHWECTACGAMVIIIHGVCEMSPGAERQCGSDMVMPQAG